MTAFKPLLNSEICFFPSRCSCCNGTTKDIAVYMVWSALSKCSQSAVLQPFPANRKKKKIEKLTDRALWWEVVGMTLSRWNKKFKPAFYLKQSLTPCSVSNHWELRHEKSCELGHRVTLGTIMHWFNVIKNKSKIRRLWFRCDGFKARIRFFFFLRMKWEDSRKALKLFLLVVTLSVWPGTRGWVPRCFSSLAN